jgi:hypothetical protein
MHATNDIRWLLTKGQNWIHLDNFNEIQIFHFIVEQLSTVSNLKEKKCHIRCFCYSVYVWDENS